VPNAICGYLESKCLYPPDRAIHWFLPEVAKVLTILHWNKALVFNFNTQESTIAQTRPEIFINFMAPVK